MRKLYRARRDRRRNPTHDELVAIKIRFRVGRAGRGAPKTEVVAELGECGWHPTVEVRVW
jgi:hypothetical protein